MCKKYFFLLFFPLHNWLHVAQNSSFSHGGKDTKGKKNCLLASSNSGVTDNSKPEVSCRYRFVWRPCSACFCALMVSWHHLKRKCTVYCDEERGIWGHPSPSWVGRRIGVRHSSSCLWQWPVPSLNLFRRCLQQFTQQGTGTLLPSARPLSCLHSSPQLLPTLRRPQFESGALYYLLQIPLLWPLLLRPYIQCVRIFLTHSSDALSLQHYIWVDSETWSYWGKGEESGLFFFFLLKINSSACGGGAYL